MSLQEEVAAALIIAVERTWPAHRSRGRGEPVLLIDWADAIDIDDILTIIPDNSEGNVSLDLSLDGVPFRLTIACAS